MDLWQNTRFHKLTLVTHSAMMVDFFCTAVKEYLSPMFTRIHANIDRECWRIFGKWIRHRHRKCITTHLPTKKLKRIQCSRFRNNLYSFKSHGFEIIFIALKAWLNSISQWKYWSHCAGSWRDNSCSSSILPEDRTLRLHLSMQHPRDTRP